MQYNQDIYWYLFGDLQELSLPWAQLAFICCLFCVRFISLAFTEVNQWREFNPRVSSYVLSQKLWVSLAALPIVFSLDRLFSI